MKELESGKSNIVIFSSRVLHVLSGAMTVGLPEDDKGSEKNKSSAERCQELG